MSPALLTHGESKSRRTTEYAIWISAKSRCYNPKNRQYRHYGGRGISMCARWLHDYSAFLADMGRRPKSRSIDRIDNNGNYEPSNCRWATKSTQRKNRRDYKSTCKFGHQLVAFSSGKRGCPVCRKAAGVRFQLRKRAAKAKK